MKTKYLVILNILLLILVLLITQYKGITNNYYINNDARTLFFVHNFPDNLEYNTIAQYSATKIGTKIPLANFYAIINKFTDFVLFTKIVAILLFLISIVYLYKLGKLIKNERYALILILLFILYSWIGFPFAGGTSKSFAVPLLIAFLYYLIIKDTLKLSIITILQATLYPPIWLVSLGTYGLSIIDLKEKNISLNMRKNAIFYVSILFSFIIILIPIYFINYGITEQISFRQAINSPDFYLGGRLPIFRGAIPFTSDAPSTINTIISIFNIGIKRPIFTHPLFILLLLAGILTFIFWKKINLPKEIYFMALSSIFFQFVASFVLFKLYFPNRYAKWSMPIFLMLLFAYGLYNLSIQKKFKYIFPTFLAILIIFYIPHLDSGLMYCDDLELYEFIKKLPKESLIAGHPIDMDCIALYGQREPFITYETTNPLFTDYYKIIKNRNLEFFSAYYAKDKKTVQDFCKKNNITHLIINRNHFASEYLNMEVIYLNPFSDYIKNLTKQKESFYLMKVENTIFESNDKFVIKCS